MAKRDIGHGPPPAGTAPAGRADKAPDAGIKRRQAANPMARMAAAGIAGVGFPVPKTGKKSHYQGVALVPHLRFGPVCR